MHPQIKNLTNLLYTELDLKKLSFGDQERLMSSLTAIDDTVRKLKVLTDDHEFESDSDEIHYFKKIKPNILASRIREVICYNLIVKKPITTRESEIKYFTNELKSLQNFFRSNSFHYQYFKNGVSEMDDHFFLRAAEPLQVPLIELVEVDLELSTPMSYLFAKFIAYEQIQYFILEQITAVTSLGIQRSYRSENAGADLIWTGDVINVVELAYGLWLTGQLNHGNASLNQIVKWLEANLSVSIGIAQRKFTEIGRRKRISVTKFIDQMREVITQKIEKDNE